MKKITDYTQKEVAGMTSAQVEQFVKEAMLEAGEIPQDLPQIDEVPSLPEGLPDPIVMYKVGEILFHTAAEAAAYAEMMDTRVNNGWGRPWHSAGLKVYMDTPAYQKEISVVQVHSEESLAPFAAEFKLIDEIKKRNDRVSAEHERQIRRVKEIADPIYEVWIEARRVQDTYLAVLRDRDQTIKILAGSSMPREEIAGKAREILVAKHGSTLVDKAVAWESEGGNDGTDPAEA